jgi:hypothetical protein
MWPPRQLALTLACVSTAAIDKADSARGAVTLDSYTFNKIIDVTSNILVKIDKQYPYGEKEDVWKAFTKDMAGGKVTHLPICAAKLASWLIGCTSARRRHICCLFSLNACVLYTRESTATVAVNQNNGIGHVGEAGYDMVCRPEQIFL